MMSSQSQRVSKDIENSMLNMDVYVGDEQSHGTTVTGPSPEDIEGIHQHSLPKQILGKKLLIGLGIFVILLASIPILLFGISKAMGENKSTSLRLVNDECLNAVNLEFGSGPIAASTIGAHSDDDGEVGNCGVNLGLGPSVWFKVAGTGGPVKVIKDDEQAFTNQMSVYSGHCGELSCVTGDNLKGNVLWNTELGKTYFVRISGVNTVVGNFNLVVEDLSLVTSDIVLNDLCADAIGLPTDGSIFQATTETAAFDIEGAGSCYRTANAGPGVWYDVIGTGGSLIATTNTSSVTLAIFKHDCGSLECQTASDLADGVASYVQWDSELAQRYHILAHSIGGQNGAPFEISVSGSKAQNEHFVINDFCKGAIGPVASDGSVIHGSTEFATLDIDGAGTCYPSLLSGEGVWYSVQGTNHTLKVYPALDSEMEPLVSVFKGECRKLKCVDGTQHSIDDYNRKVLSWKSDAEETYFLLVRGYSNAKGSFELSVESVAIPEAPTQAPTDPPETDAPVQRAVNDYCDSATDIPYIDTIVSGSTEHATTISDNAGHCHINEEKTMGPGVWYRVFGNGKTLGISTATTSSTGLDAYLSVYAGDCEDLVCVPDTTGSIAEKRSFVWKSTQGTTYYILVQGRQQQRGPFDIVVTEELVSNDNCDGALGPIPTNGTIWFGNNELASPDTIGSGTCYPSNQSGIGVWYTAMGTGERLEIISKGVGTFTPTVSIFAGLGCDSLMCIASGYMEGNQAGVLPFVSVKDAPYYVLVNGVGDSVGSFETKIQPATNQAIDSTAPVEIDVISDNDTCEGASGPLSSSDTVLTATTANSRHLEVNLPGGSCDGVGGLGLWYAVQGSDSMITLSVKTFEQTTVAGVAIYSGSCIGLSCVTAIEGSTASTAKSASFVSTADTTYYVYVHSPPSAAGPFELKIKHLDLAAPEELPTHANDVCATAFPISHGALYEGSTEGATIDGTVEASCDGYSNLGPGVWHEAVGDGNMWTLTQSKNFTDETAISVFSGSCENLECLSSHSSPAAQRAPITWPTTEGVKYFVLLENRMNDAAAKFGFSLHKTKATAAPETAAPTTATAAPSSATPVDKPANTNENDICLDAIGDLGQGGEVSGSFNFATEDEVAMCGTAPNDNPGVWFTLDGTGAGIRITACKGYHFGADAPATDTSYSSVSVFRGGCDDLQCYTGSNNTCTDEGLIEWNSEEDEVYHILISGDDDAMEEGYTMMHDKVDWSAQNCLDASEDYKDELSVLETFFGDTGNTQESGPLYDKGWLKGCDACSKWSGIVCSHNQHTIISSSIKRIHLGGLQLTGTSPHILGGLRELIQLDLADNSFQGPLDKDIGKMKNLESLNLRGNNFSGALPKDLSKMKDMIHLDLTSNAFTGAIPDDFSRFRSIEMISMGDNTLSGSLPTSLGELDTLKVFRVHKNQLEGAIPSEIGQLKELANLELHNNRFTGDMPAEICDLISSGSLTSLTADCAGDDPAVSCDCCTECH